MEVVVVVEGHPEVEGALVIEEVGEEAAEVEQEVAASVQEEAVEEVAMQISRRAQEASVDVGHSMQNWSCGAWVGSTKFFVKLPLACILGIPNSIRRRYWRTLPYIFGIYEYQNHSAPLDLELVANTTTKEANPRT